jgi:hypothetical protein
MKKFTLKALLMAAALGMGGNVWAEDYYNVTRYSQDFEDATTYTTGWTLGGNVVAAQSTINGTTQLYLNVNSKNNVQRDNTLALSANSTYFSNVTNYQFSFEYGYSHGNGNAKDNGLILYAPNNVVLFSITQPGNYCTGGKNTIYDANNVSLGTFTSEYNKGSKGVFLTFIITGSTAANNVKLTVMNGSTVIVNDVTISTTFKTIDNLYLQMTGGASHYFFDNMILKEHTEDVVAEDPTFAFKSVSGENRVYTITNPNGEGTLYYTTTTATEAPAVGDAAYSSTAESSIDIAFSTGTFYAYTVLANGTTTSAIVSQTVTGGAIQLATPYYTIISYDSEAAATTVTLNTDVNGILGTPTATIKYTIDEEEEQSVTNGGSVVVRDGTTLSFYAVADGYTKSTSVVAEATAPNTTPILWSETYNGVVSANSDFSLGSDIVSTVNTMNYYNLYYNGGATLVSENLLANNVGSNYMIRANGLYPGGSWNIAIQGVKAGDYITINGAYGNAAFNITGNGTDLIADTWHTISGSKYCFSVKNSGVVRFTMSRYGYIQSITVQRAIATPGATIGSTGYATFAADVDLDLSTLTDGFTAYYASGVADNAVTLTETTDNVVAGTGLVIKGSGAFTVTETREGASELAGNLLVGCPTATTINNTTTGYENFYVLSADVAEFQNLAAWISGGEEVTIPAGKAYLNAPATLAKLRVTFESEDATAITAIEATDAVSNGVIYNLSGQRVVKPLKGIYIQNGKKIFVK